MSIKINIYNKALDKNIFNAQKQNILDIFNLILKGTEKQDIKISVYIVEPFNTFEKMQNNASIKMYKNKYIIKINKKIVEDYHNGNRYDLELSILHELYHLFDFISIRNSKYITFNPFKKNFKSETEFILDIGYRFWTEFVAYSACFKVYDKDYYYPSSYYMFKMYKKIIDKNIELEKRVEDKPYDLEKEIYDYKDQVDCFIYLLARHISGEIYGKTRYYLYCNKTVSKKEFKEIGRLVIGIVKKIYKMYSNTYGRYFEQRIYNLGSYIMKNIYIKFGIYLTKSHGKVRFIKTIK